MNVDLNDDELAVIHHLLADADGGWGEPFKDFDGDDIDTTKTVKNLIKKLSPSRRRRRR